MNATVQSGSTTPVAANNSSRVVLLWLAAYFATAVAGAIFGLVEGGIVGFFVGGVIAGIYGLPIVSSIAILSWAFWLSRFTPLMAALAGAVTGVVSTVLLWDPIFNTDFVTAIVLAVLIGGAVPGSATTYFPRKRISNVDHGDEIGPSWQFSLRAMFLRFTVVAALMAAWSVGIAKIIESNRRMEKAVGSTDSER